MNGGVQASELDMTVQVREAVDALTEERHTKVIHHSADGKALCKPGCPKTDHTHMTRVTHAPLLEQLNEAIRETMAARPGGAASQAHTRGLLDSDALFLFSRIGSQISDWAFKAGAPHRDTPARTLRAWFVRWAQSEHPEGEARVLRRVLRGWESQIVAKLDPADEMHRKEPCPDPGCVQGFDEYTGRPIWWDKGSRESRLFPLVIVYRKDDGPQMVEKARARCRACGTEWSVRGLQWELEQAAERAAAEQGQGA